MTHIPDPADPTPFALLCWVVLGNHRRPYRRTDGFDGGKGRPLIGERWSGQQPLCSPHRLIATGSSDPPRNRRSSTRPQMPQISTERKYLVCLPWAMAASTRPHNRGHAPGGIESSPEQPLAGCLSGGGGEVMPDERPRSAGYEGRQGRGVDCPRRVRLVHPRQLASRDRLCSSRRSRARRCRVHRSPGAQESRVCWSASIEARLMPSKQPRGRRRRTRRR